MAHINESEKLSEEEKIFRDLIEHGDNFMKIQIYRNARECYQQALNTNINNNLASSKLAECNLLIKSESIRIIIIVGVIIVISVILYLLF